MKLFEENLQEHMQVLKDSRDILASPMQKGFEVLLEAISSDCKILACGNGGSAADAQHFVAELVGRFELDRRAIAAISLTTDTSNLTAIANDIGYEYVFSRQVEALGQEGDVLIAISTSGNSPNICEAARIAKTLGVRVIGFTGNIGVMNQNLLASLCDVVIAVPSDSVARIQEVHALCLHTLAQELERRA